MMKRNIFTYSFCTGALFFGLAVQAGETGPEKGPASVRGEGTDQSETRHGRREYSEIIILVREDGTTDIGGRLFKTPEELSAALSRRAAKNKDQTVRIRGESKVEYQKMVDVLDACTKAGFWNVSFSTKKAAPAPVLVTLELQSDGSVLVDGERSASREELVGKLKSLHEENSFASFRISCAPDARHGHLMTLMEDLTKAGIKSVQFLQFNEPS